MHRFLLICALFTYSTLTPLNTYCQVEDEIHLQSITSVTNIISVDEGYTTNVIITGYSKTDETFIPVFYNMIDSLHNLELFLRKSNGKKFKKEKSFKSFKTSTSLGHFYSDYLITLIQIPEEGSFKIKYKVSGKDLMLLSQVYLSSSLPLDSINYYLNIPANINYIYSLNDTSSLEYFEITKTTTPTHIAFKMKSKLKKFEPVKKNIYNDKLELQEKKPSPVIHLCFTPEEYKGREVEYFNAWYRDLIKKKIILDDSSKAFIDTKTKGINDKDSIVNILYSFVVNNFKYIDIMEGYGAICPADVNTTLIRKEGDCKAFSNLLCQSLNYKNIEAYMGITASLDYYSNASFPSLSSGNHCVCVAKPGDDFIILDATTFSPDYSLSNISIQDNYIIITDGPDQGFYHVKPTDAETNLTKWDLNLDVNDNTLSGNYHISFSGHAGNQIYDMAKDYGADISDFIIKKYLLVSSQHLDYKNIELSEHGDEVGIKGEINVNGNYLSLVGDKTYFLINFLPLPLHSISEFEKGSEYITGYKSLNEYNINIKLSDTYKEMHFDDIHIANDLIEFNMEVALEDDNLKIHYNILFDDVKINRNNLNQINEINSSINEFINKAIILE